MASAYRTRLLQLAAHRQRDPVGPDDHHPVPRGFLRGFNHRNPRILKLADDGVVVDDGSQGADRVTARGLCGFLLHHLHRPAHTKAEAGGLGQNHFLHCASISSRLSRMAAMCAMISSVAFW